MGKGPAIPYEVARGKMPRPKPVARRIKKRHRTKGGRNSDLKKLAWLRTLPCPFAQFVACSAVEVHHDRPLGAPATDRRTIPVCAWHHRLGVDSIENLGRAGFEQWHDISVDQETARYEALWQRQKAAK